MATTTYTTRQGDMLDLIVHRHYGGDQPGMVEAVLEANRRQGLAEHGPMLPRGLVIVLPDQASAPLVSEQTLVTLWD